MKKRKISLFLNILIIIFEIIGLIITYKKNGRVGIEYYTEDSNIIALLTSSIFVLFLLTNKKIPKFLKQLKYISTICLSVTLLVVIFILAPMYNFNYNFLLFKNELLYHHLLCPILSIITFIFFDEIETYNLKENIFSLSFTIIYAIVLIILNIVKIVDGPYPFLQIYNQSIIMSIVWAITILVITYIIALILRKLQYRNNKRRNKIERRTYEQKYEDAKI